MNAPTQYAVLRHRRDWPTVVLDRVVVDDDGGLGLARLPGRRPGVTLEGPFEVIPSGLAVDRGQRYLTRADGVLIVFDGICDRRWEKRLTGTPRGLAVDEHDVFIALEAASAIAVLRRDGLELRTWWQPSLSTPRDVAVDGQRRLYVVDAGMLLRLSPQGARDTTFAPTVLDARFVAVDDDGVVLVSDAGLEQVRRFDDAGQELAALPAGPTRPRAIVAVGSRVYVADAADGRLWGYDRTTTRWLGTLPGFEGPVTALGGELLVKVDAAETTVALDAGVGAAREGSILSGPHDAGYDEAWQRLWAEIARQGKGGASLHYALRDDPAPPTPSEWQIARGDDSRLPSGGRFAWVKVELTSDGYDRAHVEQVQLATTSPSYLEHLPPIYGMDDDGTLEHLLGLFQGELSDMEWLLDAMHRRFDPLQAPPDALPWLATWVAWTQPARASEAERRALLSEAHRLHEDRGTARGIRDAVERHTGIRPAIVASHEARRLWVLGQSTLGLETGLMAALPDGAILPDPSAAPVVGQITVGQAEPRPKAEFGAPLFSDTAHLFSVIVPAGAIADNAQFDLLRDVVAAEKPAHTDAHVCAIEPMMRVGFQARIGVDSIVAGPPAPMVLESRLGLYTTLGDDPEAPARVGRATIGESFSLGRATTHATGLVHRKTIGDIT